MTSDAARGIFITFEGGEGAGKSTHVRFLAKALRRQGLEVVCLREPGGTDIGEALRAVVLDPAHGEMDDRAELLIYEAARAQIVSEVIRPALERGAVVLCDRFADSTLAYQAFGRGLPREFVQQANGFACQGVSPDRTILLVTGGSASRGLKRATQRSGADRLEQAGVAFHNRVNDGFLRLAADDPERIRVVESADRRSVTAKAVFAELVDLFPWMADEAVCGPDFFAQLDVRRRPHGKRGGRGGHAVSGRANHGNAGGSGGHARAAGKGGSERRSRKGGDRG